LIYRLSKLTFPTFSTPYISLPLPHLFFLLGFLLALGEASRVFGFVLPSELAHVSSDAALALLALTILVTPANVYMLTHGAKLPKSGPEVPISGHVIRLALQVVLFATFYEKALPTISSLGL